jgi:hypothetical protein
MPTFVYINFYNYLIKMYFISNASYKGANICRAIELINHSERREIVHIRCCAHVLNLMVRKVIKYKRPKIVATTKKVN